MLVIRPFVQCCHSFKQSLNKWLQVKNYLPLGKRQRQWQPLCFPQNCVLLIPSIIPALPAGCSQPHSHIWHPPLLALKRNCYLNKIQIFSKTSYLLHILCGGISIRRCVKKVKMAVMVMQYPLALSSPLHQSQNGGPTRQKYSQEQGRTRMCSPQYSFLLLQQSDQD